MHDFMGTRSLSFDDLEISIDLAESKESFLRRVMNISTKGVNTGGEPGNLIDIRKKSQTRRININIYNQLLLKIALAKIY